MLPPAPPVQDAIFADAMPQPTPRQQPAPAETPMLRQPQPEPFAQPLQRQPQPPAPMQPPQQAPVSQYQQPPQRAPAPTQRPASPNDGMSVTQQSIARIYEACQAPPLAPAEYRAVFEILAQEIEEKGLAGSQTLANVVARAQTRGFELRRDDARFILEVVSETDPWFDQGASAVLFGGRFRNFVVARCRGQGLKLSAEELDLFDSWFAGAPPAAPQMRAPAPDAEPQGEARSTSRWWPQGGGARAQAPEPEPATAGGGDEDFPRIVRTRRG